MDVRAKFKIPLSYRWISRAGPNDDALLDWPPRYQDITLCGVFLWGYISNKLYILPFKKAYLRSRNGLSMLSKQSIKPLLSKYGKSWIAGLTGQRRYLARQAMVPGLSGRDDCIVITWRLYTINVFHLNVRLVSITIIVLVETYMFMF